MKLLISGERNNKNGKCHTFRANNVPKRQITRKEQSLEVRNNKSNAQKPILRYSHEFNRRVFL